SQATNSVPRGVGLEIDTQKNRQQSCAAIHGCARAFDTTDSGIMLDCGGDPSEGELAGAVADGSAPEIDHHKRRSELARPEYGRCSIVTAARLIVSIQLAGRAV